MIGRGTPSIQSNMPRPIGGLLINFGYRDPLTTSACISSFGNAASVQGLPVLRPGNRDLGCKCFHVN